MHMAHKTGQKNAPLILAVDDVPMNLKVLGTILHKAGYEIAAATSGSKALKVVERLVPDLILLDVMMPEMDGYAVCKQLKNNPRTREIPILFLTAKSESNDIVYGFDVGAQDYITKPFNQQELLARVRTHLTLKRTQDELRNAYQQLQVANAQLDRAARTDPLTGLANRRDILERLQYQAKNYSANQQPFVLSLADIDHFKQINDKYGHDVGDFVLASVAADLVSMVREHDAIARWGGEEFLIYLSHAQAQNAFNIFERIRKTIANNTYTINGQTISVTITFGISTYDNAQLSIEDCIKNADEALYQGKQNGRNQVVVG